MIVAFVFVVGSVIHFVPLGVANAAPAPAGHNPRTDIVISDVVIKKKGEGNTGVPGRVYVGGAVFTTWK